VPGAGNVISGNARFGIGLFGVNNTQGTVVQGNLIGLDATGSYALANNWGVFIFQTAFNQIGGTTAAARNVISGNRSYGIQITGNYAHDNVVQGNYIGTNAAGTAAVANNADGILVQGSSNNTIGGTVPGAGNVISGNGRYGINLLQYGSDTSGNRVQRNLIGTNAAGTGAVGNASDGVHIFNGAHDNQIGAPPTGSVTGFGNTIAFNGGAGVAVLDAASTGNSIPGNALHHNHGNGIHPCG